VDLLNEKDLDQDGGKKENGPCRYGTSKELEGGVIDYQEESQMSQSSVIIFGRQINPTAESQVTHQIVSEL
jgi:hypothetical protein